MFNKHITIKEKKYISLSFLILLGLLLTIMVLPFIEGISGGIILYVLLNPLYKKISPYFKHKSIPAILLIVFSFLVIILPLTYAIHLALIESIRAVQSYEFSNFLANIPFINQDFKVVDFIQTHLTSLSNFIQNITFGALEMTTSILLNFFIMYLIIFYLFLNGDDIYQNVLDMIPFQKKNSEELIAEQKKVIKSTIISNGIVSLTIGALFTVGLYFAGFDNLILWLFLSTLVAFLPVVGIQFIWIPTGIYFISEKEYITAIGILLWGSFLSFILDAFIRQLVQNWAGKVHPFISLMGLVIGIIYFGITGIVIGPLFLSLTFSSFKFFKKEYGGIH